MSLYRYGEKQFQKLEQTSFGTLGILERFDLQPLCEPRLT